MKGWIRTISLCSLLTLLVVGLGACGNKSTKNVSGYDNSINKGLDAVAENKMNKAQSYFENALTQNSKGKKAKVYREQAKAYNDTQAQLRQGEIKKAKGTIATGVKINNGAKSLATKLTKLQATVGEDLKEYQQLNKDVTAQLKITDDNYSSEVLKQVKAIKWNQKPYLKQLKPKVTKLIKLADRTSSSNSGSQASSTSVTESDSSSNTNKVSATVHKNAEQTRLNIVQADPDHWDSAALAQVPDSVIDAAAKKANEDGGDPGTIAHSLAKQYPNIEKNTETLNSADSTTGLSMSDAKSKLSHLDFYTKNSDHIVIDTQDKLDDGWIFWWHFKGGGTGGSFTVKDDGSLSADDNSGNFGTGNWKS